MEAFGNHLGQTGSRKAFLTECRLHRAGRAAPERCWRAVCWGQSNNQHLPAVPQSSSLPRTDAVLRLGLHTPENARLEKGVCKDFGASPQRDRLTGDIVAVHSQVRRLHVPSPATPPEM